MILALPLAPGPPVPMTIEAPRPDDAAARIVAPLARASLHEFAAEADDAASAAAFALLANPAGKPVLWLRDDRARRGGGCIYAPGLMHLGIDPAMLTMVSTTDDKALLKAAVDGVRCAGFGVVLIELWGRSSALDLTATRRLTLAAERSGVKALLVRANGVAEPSAAWTRWRIGASPSAPLVAGAPGHPCFEIELLRDRAGRSGFSTRLEWNRDAREFREPQLPGPVVALSRHRAPDPGWRRAG